MANNNRAHVPEEERCKGTSRQSKERYNPDTGHYRYEKSVNRECFVLDQA